MKIDVVSRLTNVCILLVCIHRKREADMSYQMTTDQEGKLIGTVVRALRAAANIQGKDFDEGDTFFALAFKSDTELQRIAKLAEVG